MADDTNKDFQHIVRVANADIKGEKHILYALTKIQGVSIMFANAACKLAGVDTEARAGDLPGNQVKKLDQIIKDPANNGMPRWMLNRRDDYETGESIHLLGGDIKFVKDQDIKRLRKIKTYRGIRHSQGLTVRGQKTQGNFRRNKGKGPGVMKRKANK